MSLAPRFELTCFDMTKGRKSILEFKPPEQTAGIHPSLLAYPAITTKPQSSRLNSQVRMPRCSSGRRRGPSPALLGAVLLLLFSLLSASPVDARKRDGAPDSASAGQQQCDCGPSIAAAVQESKTELVATLQAALADVQARLETRRAESEQLEAALAEKDAALASLRAQLETAQKAREEAEAKATASSAEAAEAEAASACRVELAEAVAKQNEAIQSERSARSALQQAEADASQKEAESSRKLKELTKEVDTSRGQVKSMNDRYAEARRELMDAQRETRQLHQQLGTRWVNTTLIAQDAAAYTTRTVRWGREAATKAKQTASAAWSAVSESTDAAVQVVTPVVTELSEEIATKYREVTAALAPHWSKLVARLGDGIGPHYRSVRSYVGKAYGDTVQPIVDGTVAPLYREHVAPLLGRAGEAVESCRLTAVSGIEQGTAAMMDTISKYDEEVKEEESPMRQRALAHLRSTHDHAEDCVRKISYVIGASVGLYLFGGLLLRLAIVIVKVGTSFVWLPCWFVYWIVSKAVGGGTKNKGGDATANGTNGAHASHAA